MPGWRARVCCGRVALALRAETFAEVPPEPPIDVVDTIAALIKASRAEAVIALGGGSVMDGAKLASLCVRHGKAGREFVGSS
jgi:alcohol dehydrogenase class IV